MIVTSDDIQLSALLREFNRRNEHPFTQYTPTNKEGHDQLSFHSCPVRYRLLFGGNQSGKSYAAAYEISCWLTGKHPYRTVPVSPIEVWSISAEYETLKQGVYRHLRNLIPDWEIEKMGPNVPNNSFPSFIRLKNGSQVTFKSAKGESREKFQAAAVHLIHIDEEIDEKIWEELEARTLNTGGQFILTLTPVESYDWIVKLEDMAAKKDPHVFITYLNTDQNHYLNQDTVQYLKSKWSLETLETRFYGKTRRTTGLIYNTWDDKKHVIPAFPIPPEWPRWNSIDPGIRTFASLWIAVGPDNHAYAYRELYAHNEPLHQVAIAIKCSEGYILNETLSHKFGHFVWEPRNDETVPEKIYSRVIDDKRGSRLITGEDGVLGQLYSRYGIGTTPANKAKRQGIEEVRHWLRDDKNGVPFFRVFDSLENFKEERRTYRIRDNKGIKKNSSEPIDDPIKKNDHLMDCWRYTAMERPDWNKRDMTVYDLLGNPITRKSAYENIVSRNQTSDYEEFVGA